MPFFTETRSHSYQVNIEFLSPFSAFYSSSALLMTHENGMRVGDQFRRLIHIRKRYLHISSRPGTVKNYIDFKYVNKPWRSKLKEMEMSYSLGRGWYSTEICPS